MKFFQPDLNPRHSFFFMNRHLYDASLLSSVIVSRLAAWRWLFAPNHGFCQGWHQTGNAVLRRWRRSRLNSISQSPETVMLDLSSWKLCPVKMVPTTRMLQSSSTDLVEALSVIKTEALAALRTRDRLTGMFEDAKTAANGLKWSSTGKASTNPWDQCADHLQAPVLVILLRLLGLLSCFGWNTFRSSQSFWIKAADSSKLCSGNKAGWHRPSLAV